MEPFSLGAQSAPSMRARLSPQLFKSKQAKEGTDKYTTGTRCSPGQHLWPLPGGSQPSPLFSVTQDLRHPWATPTRTNHSPRQCRRDEASCPSTATEADAQGKPLPSFNSL